MQCVCHTQFSIQAYITLILKLILTKHKKPKNQKLQLKSSTLKLRQEKEKKDQGTYLDGV